MEDESNQGQPRGALSKDKIADLWIEHSNQMWRTVNSNALITIAVFTGWFSMRLQHEQFLACGILALGVLIMGVQWIVISRMAQFTSTFLGELKDEDLDFGKPLGNLNGKQTARSIPALCGFFFVLLLPFTWIEPRMDRTANAAPATCCSTEHQAD